MFLAKAQMTAESSNENYKLFSKLDLLSNVSELVFQLRHCCLKYNLE